MEISTIAGEVQIGGSFAVFTGNVVEEERGKTALAFVFQLPYHHFEREKVLDSEVLRKRKSGPIFFR